MVSDRAKAFRATRQIIGEETCPLAGRIKRGEAPLERVEEVSAVTHQLRATTVGLLLLLTKDRVTCPNCDEVLPKHRARCHLGRLIKAME